MQIALATAIPLQIFCNIVSALAFGAGRGRRALSWIFVLATAAIPWFVTASPVVLAALAVGGFLPFFRFVDLARDPHPMTAFMRVWFFLSPFDVRKVKRVTKAVEPLRVLGILTFLVLFALSYWIIMDVEPTLSGPLRWCVRWLSGGVLLYALLESGFGILDAGYRAMGFALPKLHDAPILSRSLGEFWAVRWNLTVHGFLNQHCFRPFARKRMLRLGMASAFLASGILHASLVYVAIRNVDLTLLMVAFFMAQALLVIVERPLRVARWRPLAGRIWTIGWMAITMPLFVEPTARIIQS